MNAIACMSNWPKNGVQTAIYYGKPVHLQRAGVRFGDRLGVFPHTERAFARALSLPFCQEMDLETPSFVTNTLAQAVR